MTAPQGFLRLHWKKKKNIVTIPCFNWNPIRLSFIWWIMWLYCLYLIFLSSFDIQGLLFINDPITRSCKVSMLTWDLGDKRTILLENLTVTSALLPSQLSHLKSNQTTLNQYLAARDFVRSSRKMSECWVNRGQSIGWFQLKNRPCWYPQVFLYPHMHR